MSENKTAFRPDPLWLIDALADDLMQIDRLGNTLEEDIRLYERGLILIGRAFPTAAQYALEAFQNMLAERAMADQKPAGLRRRADSTTRNMLMNLMQVMLLLPSEDDRSQIAALMEFVRKWPDQYLNRDTDKAANAPPEPQPETEGRPADEEPPGADPRREAEKQPETEAQTDNDRRASESYRQMKARHLKEVYDFSKAFAFSNSQFEEGMRSLGLDPSDKEQIASIGAGGFVRKTDGDAFKAMMHRHRLEHEVAMDADRTGEEYLLDMFRCELADHEYGYTRDPEPALMALGLFGDDIESDERLLHAFETACRQQAEWYDKHHEG